MKSNAKIAILMATYNGEKYVEEQIQSILDQSKTDWSIFVHDDGSTDSTVQILKEYVERYPEKIFLVDGESTGCARDNFFYLLGKIEADYYMFCDQDDIWLSEKIEKSFEKMLGLKEKESKMKETPNLVFTELTVVDNYKNVIAEKMSAYQNLNCSDLSINRLLIQNCVTGCTMMINRVLRDMMLKYSDVRNIKMHDWWAGLIAAEFGKIAFIEDATILYRQHSENSVGAQNDNSIEYNINRVKNKETMKFSLDITRMQAAELASSFELSDEHIITQYANCMKRNKISRICFYLKNRILKTGVARLIGQMVLG